MKHPTPDFYQLHLLYSSRHLSTTTFAPSGIFNTKLPLLPSQHLSTLNFPFTPIPRKQNLPSGFPLGRNQNKKPRLLYNLTLLKVIGNNI